MICVTDACKQHSGRCPTPTDLTGQRFGRLVVLEYAGKARNRSSLWRVRCDCGTEKTVSSDPMKAGRTVSCGCHSREVARARCAGLVSHGLSETSTHYVWSGMRQRCHNPNSKDYPRYGGRGIVVCERWRDSFENFLEDMGEMPEGLSLDRINNDGPYAPDNCRWATNIEQQANKRTSRRYSHAGETHCLAEWARRAGLRYYTLANRIDAGWDFAVALTAPVRRAK